MTIEYPSKTLRALFGRPILPAIRMSLADVSRQAQKLAGKLSISGVQPKLSVTLRGDELLPVTTGGRYLLKPQTQTFPELPQNESLCMGLGKTFGLDTPDNILIELSDGSLAYLVRRFDRQKRGARTDKLACEDMGQILGGDKYAGSHEQIAGAVREFCTFPPLELQRLFEMVLLNFAIGNGDAHKKNFSLLTRRGAVALSPAYDLVSSRLVIPEEADELALTLNGRQNRLGRGDFLAFATHLQLPDGFAERKVEQLLRLRDEFARQIRASHLSSDLRERLIGIVTKRLARLARS
jgi:serine/threonine-protein kinase HipA